MKTQNIGGIFLLVCLLGMLSCERNLGSSEESSKPESLGIQKLAQEYYAEPAVKSLKINEGPLEGLIARWQKLDGKPVWIVDGDEALAKPLVKYTPRSFTYGVTFRDAHAQNDFKKIYWVEDWLEAAAGDMKDPNSHAYGFGIMSASLDLLSGKIKPSLRTFHSIMFHPKMFNVAKQFFLLVHEDNADLLNGWNQFEAGLLLGYAEVDAYAWAFGTKLAKKHYPFESFIKHQEGYDVKTHQVEEWRKLGTNRLQKILTPTEFEYAIASYPPTDDPKFNTASE